MKAKKCMAMLLAFCLAAGSLAGCQSSEKGTDSGQKEEKTEKDPEEIRHVSNLRIGTTYANNSFNMFGQDDAFGRMNYNSFVSLNFWHFDEKGELSGSGCLFQDWEISEEDTQLLLSYDLEGLEWHDGQPVTSEDILFTFDFYKAQNYPLFLHVSDVQVLEEGKLQVTFDEPMAFSFMNQTTLMYHLMPEHIWGKVENPTEYGGEDMSIGCGPYRLVSKDADAQISYYEAVEDFPLGELTVDKVELHSYDNQASLITALQNDEIDVMYGYSASLDTTLLPLIEQDEAIDLGESVNTATYQIVFGFNQYPTSDLPFRQAVRYALDYEVLNQSITGGYGSVATQGAVSPSCVGYLDGLEENKRDLEKAKEILDQAGYQDLDGDGFRELPDGSPMDVKIALQSATDLYKRYAEIIQLNLAEAGIRVSVDEQTISNKDYTAELRKNGSYEIYLGMTTVGIASWTGIASYIADVVITSGQHFGTYADEEYLKAYTAMTQATSYEEYAEAFGEIQEMNASDVPAVALAIMKTFYPYRTDRITGWTNYPAWGVINVDTWYQAVEK